MRERGKGEEASSEKETVLSFGAGWLAGAHVNRLEFKMVFCLWAALLPPSLGCLI